MSTSFDTLYDEKWNAESYISSGCCLVASSKRSEKSTVDRYLSPKEGMTTTMFLPAFSGLAATVSAALTAAPEEIPASTPSLVASNFAVSMATAEGTWIISSKRAVEMISRIKDKIPNKILNLNSPY